MLSRCRLSSRSGSKAVPCSRAVSCMRSMTRSRACGMQRERHAERGGGALARVVVGRGADAAAREDEVAARERVLQVGGDARRIVADVARPGERQAARGEQLDHLGQVLVGALAGEDLVADDEKADVHASGVLAGSASAAAAARSAPAPPARRRAPSASAPRSALQRGQQVVREPERREREDQRVEPDRDQDQEGREDQRQRAHRPEQRRRRAEAAADDAHAEQRPAMRRAAAAARSAAAGVRRPARRSARTRYVSQPQISGGSTSTSGGTNQNGMLTTSAASGDRGAARARSPGRSRSCRRGALRAAGSGARPPGGRSPASSAAPRPAARATTNTGTASATIDQRRDHARPAAGADRAQPGEQRVEQRPVVQRRAHRGDRRLPEEVAERRARAPPTSASGSSESAITFGCRQ